MNCIPPIRRRRELPAPSRPCLDAFPIQSHETSLSGRGALPMRRLLPRARLASWLSSRAGAGGERFRQSTNGRGANPRPGGSNQGTLTGAAQADPLVSRASCRASLTRRPPAWKVCVRDSRGRRFTCVICGGSTGRAGGSNARRPRLLRAADVCAWPPSGDERPSVSDTEPRPGCLGGRTPGQAPRPPCPTPLCSRGRPDSDVSSPRYACGWHGLRIPSQGHSVIDSHAVHGKTPSAGRVIFRPPSDPMRTRRVVVRFGAGPSRRGRRGLARGFSCRH